MRLTGTSLFAAIKLAESGKVPNEVQVLRVGKFNHPKYGEFEISKAVLAEMKSNFDARVRGIDVAFDYFHESDKEASGWPGGLELREDGTQLWAVNVDWTPTAERKLAEKEIRYFSPDFAFKWKDPESGKTYFNVLFGGGLTNRPFVKEMQAIVADEIQGDEMKELEQAQARIKELETANVKLSEEKAALETQVSAAPKADEVDGLKKQLSEAQEKVAKLEKEKADAEAAKVLAEKEKSFNVLLSEGKACAAQKEAFIKGDMEAFIKLAQPVNMQGKGDSGTQERDEDRDAKVLKLAEQKRKENPKLELGDAISLARKEIK